MGTSVSVVMAPEDRFEAPWLGDVLDTIAEFGQASIGLVAWELCLPEEALAPAWKQAIESRLIREVEECSTSGELMYRLMPFSELRRSTPHEAPREAPTD